MSVSKAVKLPEAPVSEVEEILSSDKDLARARSLGFKDVVAWSLAMAKRTAQESGRE
jgi:hypothetical protein